MIIKHKKKILIVAILLGLVFIMYRELFLETPNFVASELLGNATLNGPEKVSDIAVKNELLGKAELSFAGSTSGRAHNIELGIARINDTVVLPGEEFSYIKVLGPISEQDGFSEEKAFRNGEVTKGLGGGLCQVSTILFQAVLDAGLSVNERWNHTFLVPLYQVGLDATYSDPAPDFKFVNNTSAPIVIKGWIENDKAIVEIHGVPDGRVASISEAEIYNRTPMPDTKYIYDPTLMPGEEKCQYYTQSGFTAKRLYTVSYPDGTERTQEFISKYSPHARVCKTNAVKYMLTPFNTTP